MIAMLLLRGHRGKMHGEFFYNLGKRLQREAKQEQSMHCQRWPSSSNGRSRTVTFGDHVWTVATAGDDTLAFENQVMQSLDLLDRDLKNAGSARTHILSLQILLADIADRPKFDLLWQHWIGPNPEHWPQRACFGASLAPGLLVELVAVAAPSSATLVASI